MAPPIKAGDATTEGLWAFSREPEWNDPYENCRRNAAKKAPLNIDTNDVHNCSVFCRLSVKYKPTTCSVSMINNIPTVTFAPNCFIKFNNDFYYLRKMTIHYTSMHTINKSHTELEILLYHNANYLSDADGGIIISVLFNIGNDYGTANEFLNEFINKLPANSMPIEKDVEVSSTWSPEQLFPESSKAFFYYEGSLPYPPCTQNWTFIIFEEIVPIAKNIVDTVCYILGKGNKNIRSIQKKPADIDIFYNSNKLFDVYQDVSEEAILAATTPTAKPVVSNTSSSWLKQNIYSIKGIIITIVLILMIYVAIRFAKVIVQNDLLNSFILRQLKKKQHLAAQEAQQEQAQQQAAEYGEAAPVNNINMNNNNNN